MSKEGKEQIAFRVSPEMKRNIDLIMGTDGSRNRNEFLENAVNFYLDHLLAMNMTTLPVAVTSAIDGRLGLLEDRLSALAFNNAVELDMLARIIAEEYNFTDADLRKFRAESVKSVRQTNGHVSLEKQMSARDDDLWLD